jgi:hypothetical protein
MAIDAGLRSFSLKHSCGGIGPAFAEAPARMYAYGGELDMLTLVWTRGRDFPLGILASRLKCPRCGSRQATVFFEPPSIRGRAAIS